MLRKAGLQNLAKHLNSSSQVVMRVDFNVPIEDHRVADPNRIKATIPTIQEVLNKNPKSLVLLSHLGRPQGISQDYSLKPVLAYLNTYLNRKVTFLNDCVGEDVINTVNRADNEIFLCENVRFHIEETGSKKIQGDRTIKAAPQKVEAFRDQLSQLGNCFVNDAFGTAHRAHSSVVGIKHKYRVAGSLMKKELNYLGSFLESPKKPVVVILGGAKIADKINLIKKMIGLADEIILGGGLKNPFLTEVFKKKLGSTLNSIPKNPEILKEILDYAKEKNCKIHFPCDYRLSKELEDGQEIRLLDFDDDVPKDWEIVDMGPKTAKTFDDVISKAGSILWNGPMGIIELEDFKQGSVDVLNSIIRQTQRGATSIIGGGDSVGLVNSLGLKDKVSYISTGGGATLQFLQGKQLPGVACLSDIDEIQ